MNKPEQWVITKSYRQTKWGWVTHWEVRDSNRPRGPYFKLNVAGRHQTTPPQIVDSLLVFTAPRGAA